MFAGLVEISLAPLLRRLRALFPPAISGFIVVIVGLQLGVIGIGDLLGVEHIRPADLSLSPDGWRPDFGDDVRAECLGPRHRAPDLFDARHRHWDAGQRRIGVGVDGCDAQLSSMRRSSRYRSRIISPTTFEFSLIPAFLMAGTAAMLRTVGVITTCQKINDLDWKRPELESIQAGIIADGIGCVIGGLLGVIGMNSAAGLVGVAKATGATSRYIGFSCAAILVIFAFIPKYAALFLIMPQPVIGALDGVYRLVHDRRRHPDHRLAERRQPGHLRRRRVAVAGSRTGDISGVFQTGRAASAPVYRQHDVDWRHVGVSAQSDLPHWRDTQRNLRIRERRTRRSLTRKALARPRQGMVGPLGRR